MKLLKDPSVERKLNGRLKQAADRASNNSLIRQQRDERRKQLMDRRIKSAKNWTAIGAYCTILIIVLIGLSNTDRILAWLSNTL